MSQPPDSKSGDRQRTSDAGGHKPGRRAQATSYEVGYGKPPVATRFVKGQSGNPRGRPRKQVARPPRLSDALSNEFLEKEAYRPVTLRENGQATQLPAAQAVFRSLVIEAIKGKRLSQKYLLEMLAREETRYLDHKIQKYLRLEAIKRKGERRLAEHRRRELPPPELLPHPDDIVLNPSTGEAFVRGPETEEDVRECEHNVRLRNFFLLCSAHASKTGTGLKFQHEGQLICGYMLFAMILDRYLPRRYRWKNNEEVILMMDYQRLSRRERERRIAAEAAHLQETMPPSRLPPDVQRQVERLAARFRGRRKVSAADPVAAGSTRD